MLNKPHRHNETLNVVHHEDSNCMASFSELTQGTKCSSILAYQPSGTSWTPIPEAIFMMFFVIILSHLHPQECGWFCLQPAVSEWYQLWLHPSTSSSEPNTDINTWSTIQTLHSVNDLINNELPVREVGNAMAAAWDRKIVHWSFKIAALDL